MAARFWVGGTGTWDASTTTHWASSSNGAGGQSVPTTNDTVTFDASSGGGVCTLGAATASLGAVTMGAYTGELNLGSYLLKCTTFSCTGTGARTLAFATGAIECTGTGSSLFTMATATNLTVTYGSGAYIKKSAASSTACTITTASKLLPQIRIAAGSCAMTFTNVNCAGLDWTGATGSWATASNAVTIRGAMTLVSGMTSPADTQAVTFGDPGADGTYDLTFATRTWNAPMIFDSTATARIYRFADAVSSTGDITLTSGTLDTNGQTVTSDSFISNATSGSRTLTLGATVWTLGNTTGVLWDVHSSMTLTSASNTSQIIGTGVTGVTSFVGGGKTYYDVNLRSHITGAGFNWFEITGANSYHNLTFDPSSGAPQYRILATQTVTGTFTATGYNASTGRIFVTVERWYTSTRTISAAAVSLTNVDFQRIAGAGAAIPFTGTSIGNAGGNTNITPTAAVTRYWVGDASGNWSDTANWSTSDGGGSGASYPLCHDTAMFTAASFNTAGRVVTLDVRLGSNINMTAMDVSTDFAIGTSDKYIVGDFLVGSATFTVSGGTSIYLWYGALHSISGTMPCSVQLHGYGAGASAKLAANFTIPTASLFDLQTGSIDLQTYTLSTGQAFIGAAGATVNVTFGSGSILELTRTGNILYVYSTSTSVTVTDGGGSIRKTDAGATACTFTNFAATVYWPNTKITAGSAAITFTAYSCNGLDWTGATGSWAAASTAFACDGDFKLVSGMTMSHTATILWKKTSGTATITAGTKTFASNITVGASSSLSYTVALAEDITTTGSFTHTGGVLDIGTRKIECATWSSSGGLLRRRDCGAGSIIRLTGTGTIWNESNATNLTYTTPENCTIQKYANSATACTFNMGAGTYHPPIAITTGSAAITFTGVNCMGLDWTGATGSWAAASNAFGCKGNFKLVSGMTMSADDVTTFAATTTGKTITMDTKTFAAGVTFNGVGGEWTLQDDFTTAGTLTLTNGTLKTNGKAVQSTTFSGAAGGTITLGATTYTMTAAGTPWSADASMVLTANTGTLKFTDASASTKTFAGGGKTTYNNVWFTGAGTGAFIIQGSNTFADFKVDTPPHTITFTSGTTQTVSTFTVSGSAGNLMTINSSSAGSVAYLSKPNGTVTCDYLSLTDNVAQGGALWTSGAHSTKNTNVSGWDTAVAPTKSVKYSVVATPAAKTKSERYALRSTPAPPTKSLKYAVPTTPAAKTKSAQYKVTDWWLPTALTVTKGSIVSGTLQSVYNDVGGDYLILAEQAGAPPGFQYDFTFKNANLIAPHGYELHVHYWYSGSAGHNIKLLQYNFTTTAWVNVTAATDDFPQAAGFGVVDIQLLTGADYFGTNELRIRIDHVSAGNVTHEFQIDELMLVHFEDITKSLTYTVKTTPTAPTKSLEYVVTSASAPVDIELDAQYAVTTTPAATELDLAYEIKSPVAPTKSLKYTVTATASPVELDAGYTVTTTPAATELDAGYAVVTTPAAPTKSLAYTVRSANAAITKSLAYRVTTSPAIQRAAKYVVTIVASAIEHALAYAVASQQAIQHTAKYTVPSTPAAKTKGLAYRVTTETPVTKSLTYAVPSTPAATELDLTYAVVVPGSVTLDTQYTVIATTPARELDAGYAVRTSASLESDLTYEIIATTPAFTRSLKYTVTTTPSAIELAVRYVLQPHYIIEQSTQYAVKAPASQAIPAQYATRVSAAVTLDESYAVRSVHSAERDTQYAVVTTPAATSDLQYAVRTSGSPTKSLRYEVIIVAAITRSLTYSVITVHAIEHALAYAIETSGAPSKALTYDVRSQQAVDVSSKYAVITTKSVTRGLVYGLATVSAIQKATTYHVRTENARTATVAYHVRTQGSLIKSISYRVATQHSQTFILGYEIGITHGITKSVKYTIATSPAVTRPERYAVITSHSLTLDTGYEVESPVAVQKTLRYDIVVVTAIERSMRYCIRLWPYDPADAGGTPSDNPFEPAAAGTSRTSDWPYDPDTNPYLPFA